MPNTQDFQLPFLPGTQFDFDKKPENFRKSHSFDFRNGIAFSFADKPGIGIHEMIYAHSQGAEPLQHQLNKKVPRTSASSYAALLSSDLPAQPSWITFDRKVLRFYAYFKEAVQERREEHFRVRKCSIFFYLEDDSIHVSEPKTNNSGIPQGVLIARHRILKPNSDEGQHYIFDDLKVNETVTFYGKTFKIIGCDGFTRNFLEKCGIQMPSNSSFPSDPYDEHLKDINSRMKAVHPYHATYSLKKFLEHDRHVLRFFCLWDDTLSLFGEARQMVLNYFLADDTVEIYELAQKNSGRDGHSNSFLRRGKLPKLTSLYSPDAHPEDKPDNYYTERDLGIGEVICVYGRMFVLCDCDEYTRSYYQDQYGIQLSDSITFDDNDEEVQAWQSQKNIPPYNGYGSEEDSLGSYYSLIPKPPKKDFKKLMQFDQVVLRFEAHLETTRTADKGRRFVLCYYLADESIQIFEPHQRNTGIVGGKFLERTRKLKKPEGGHYTNTDFAIGAKIDCFGHVFVLQEADDYAIKYMSEHPELFPQSNLQSVLRKLEEHQSDIPRDIKSSTEFESAIAKAIPNLSRHEIVLATRILFPRLAQK